ncbi:hypothetical protein [Mesorhizobium sp. 113-3-3]|nr:hypothetical protein [Mesorhizobium sp. 113-3-3]
MLLLEQTEPDQALAGGGQRVLARRPAEHTHRVALVAFLTLPSFVTSVAA